MRIRGVAPALCVVLGTAGSCVLTTSASAGPGAEAPFDLTCANRVLEVAQRFYGERLEVRSLIVHPDSAHIDVRNPKEPLHVDRFACQDGAVEAPAPVQAGRDKRALESQLFELTREDLERLPAMLASAIEVVDTEDAQVTHVVLDRYERDTDYGRSWSRPRFLVYVEGPRGGGYAEYRLDGKRGHVERW